MVAPTDYIELALARVNRAWEHIEQLKAETSAFFDTKPYRIVTEEEPQGAQKLVHYLFRVDRQPPARLRLIMGDAIHNLRAILDNLVWGLGQRCGEPPSSGLKFRLFIDEAEFIQKGLPRLQKAFASKAPKAIDLIRDLQPYQRRDDPTGHLLWILNRLSNQEKHDVPLVVAAVHNLHVVVPSRRIPGAGHIIPSPIQDGAELIGMSFPKNNPPPNIEPKVTASIAFDKQGDARGAFADQFLIEANGFIRDNVVAKFEPLFT